jgi:hypothetical protein
LPTFAPTSFQQVVPKFSIATVTSASNDIKVYLTLESPVDNAGTLFCMAVRTSFNSPPSSVNVIQQAGYSKAYASVKDSVTVQILSLQALTSYDVYCYLKNVYGYGNSLSYSLSNKQVASTSCCRTISWSDSNPASVYGDIYQYDGVSDSNIFEFSLSSAPSTGSSITITPLIRDENFTLVASTKIKTVPTSFGFSSSSTNLIADFYLDGNPALSGTFYLDLNITGMTRWHLN